MKAWLQRTSSEPQISGCDYAQSEAQGMRQDVGAFVLRAEVDHFAYMTGWLQGGFFLGGYDSARIHLDPSSCTRDLGLLAVGIQTATHRFLMSIARRRTRQLLWLMLACFGYIDLLSFQSPARTSKINLGPGHSSCYDPPMSPSADVRAARETLRHGRCT